MASGPLLSEVFGLPPLEVWICHISSCGGKKRIPTAALGRTENVNKLVFFLSLALCTLWPCVSMAVVSWRVPAFALGVSVLVCKCFLFKCLREGGCEELPIKRVNLRASDGPHAIAKCCLSRVRTALSLFNRLWPLARDQFSHAFVR